MPEVIIWNRVEIAPSSFPRKVWRFVPPGDVLETSPPHVLPHVAYATVPNLEMAAQEGREAWKFEVLDESHVSFARFVRRRQHPQAHQALQAPHTSHQLFKQVVLEVVASVSKVLVLQSPPSYRADLRLAYRVTLTIPASASSATLVGLVGVPGPRRIGTAISRAGFSSVAYEV